MAWTHTALQTPVHITTEQTAEILRVTPPNHTLSNPHLTGCSCFLGAADQAANQQDPSESSQTTAGKTKPDRKTFAFKIRAPVSISLEAFLSKAQNGSTKSADASLKQHPCQVKEKL